MAKNKDKAKQDTADDLLEELGWSEPEAPIVEPVIEAPIVEPVIEAPKVKAYAVAKGKSITTRRGLLRPGEEVRSSDFAEGQRRIDALIVAGVVVER